MSEQLDQGQAQTAEAVGGAQASQPELTIQDLQNLRAIIDVSSQRGAFKAAELQAVGAAFNKLNDFLNAVTPAQSAGDTQQGDAETPAA